MYGSWCIVYIVRSIFYTCSAPIGKEVGTFYMSVSWIVLRCSLKIHTATRRCCTGNIGRNAITSCPEKFATFRSSVILLVILVVLGIECSVCKTICYYSKDSPYMLYPPYKTYMYIFSWRLCNIPANFWCSN